MRAGILFLAMHMAVRTALAGSEGPLTSVVEFLRSGLDMTVSELASVPDAVAEGETAAAEKIFADHLRATVTCARFSPEWKRGTAPDPRVKNIAADVMRYKLSAVGYHHPFPPHGVDWVANPTIGAYCEWPWQLSRHEDLTLLAEYYARTGDEAAAEVWVELMDSWLNQAILQTNGTVTAEMRACWRTLDASIRVPRWTLQIAAFARSPKVTDHFLARLGASIWEHGRYLRAHPTSGGNWLVHEMSGLTQLALAHQYLRDADEWLSFADRKLREQYTGQVYPDGFQVETSTDYQVSILKGYLDVARAYEKVGLPAPTYIRAGLKKSFAVYPRLSRPDRRTPGLNDGGCANVIYWSRIAQSIYPDDPMFAWFATNGQEGSAPPFLSDAMEYAGYITFRNSWSTNAVWGFFDAGADHWRGWHSHEDALNFLLSAYGRNMIIEPGNYRYDKSEMRRYVITTPSHNTILIDGCGQCRKVLGRKRDFSMDWKSDYVFRTTPGLDCAQCTYADGYGATAEIQGVSHCRTVLFVKRSPLLKPFFVIIDKLSSKDGRTHAFETLWHLDGGSLKVDGNRFVDNFGGGVTLTGVSSGPAPFVDKRGIRDPLQGWMPIWDESKNHEHRPVPTPVQGGTFVGECRTVTFLQPNAYGEKSPVVKICCSSSGDELDFELALSDGARLSFRDVAKGANGEDGE